MEPSDELIREFELQLIRAAIVKLTVRGRLMVESDIQAMEEHAGQALPEVRAQVDRIFGMPALSAGPQPAPRQAHRPEPPQTLTGPQSDSKRGPGRPPKSVKNELPTGLDN